MIRIEGDDFECAGNLTELLADAAMILQRLFIIAAEQLGPKEAYKYVLVKLPELVKDVVRGKKNGRENH